MIISISLAVVSMYTTSALLYHEVKVERRRRWVGMAIENKHGFQTKIICILFGFVCLLRNVYGISYLVVEFMIWSMNTTVFMNTKVSKNRTVAMVTSTEPDTRLSLACQFLSVTGEVFIVIGFGLTVWFLWIRLKIFFVHPRLKDTVSNDGSGKRF